MNLILNYGLFLIKIVTVFISTMLFIIVISNVKKRKQNNLSNLRITLLNKEYKDIKNSIILSKMQFYEKKLRSRINKKNKKIHIKDSNNIKPTLYVLDFKGTIQANEGECLRKEISAILSVVKKKR